jgi:hypothetical protein
MLQPGPESLRAGRDRGRIVRIEARTQEGIGLPPPPQFYHQQVPSLEHWPEHVLEPRDHGQGCSWTPGADQDRPRRRFRSVTARDPGEFDRDLFRLRVRPVQRDPDLAVAALNRRGARMESGGGRNGVLPSNWRL